MSCKVKVSKVDNLTDARYFAAMGVDYLGFCCNSGTERYCSPNKIKEIIEWVEGPNFVLEFDGWQSEEEIMKLQEMHPEFDLHFGIIATYETRFSKRVFKDIILENLNFSDERLIDFPVFRSDRRFVQLTDDELLFLEKLSNERQCFLDINFKKEDIIEMRKALPNIGIILRGGNEEKVGIKSFEELDLLFDNL